MLERLLHMRQGHHLPPSQPYAFSLLSYWWDCSESKGLGVEYGQSPSARRQRRWVTRDLSPNLFCCFGHDSFPRSRISCNFVELFGRLRGGARYLLMITSFSVILVSRG